MSTSCPALPHARCAECNMREHARSLLALLSRWQGRLAESSMKLRSWRYTSGGDTCRRRRTGDGNAPGEVPTAHGCKPAAPLLVAFKAGRFPRCGSRRAIWANSSAEYDAAAYLVQIRDLTQSFEMIGHRVWMKLHGQLARVGSHHGGKFCVLQRVCWPCQGCGNWRSSVMAGQVRSWSLWAEGPEAFVVRGAFAVGIIPLMQ